MRSKVAEELREADRSDMRALPLDERLALVRTMSEESIALLMSTQQIDRDEAIRRIERSRKAGRRPSVLNEE